ncbi:hypothetical protein NP493_283g02023 [Ridgeia piscesae]|uniref:Peptidase M14 domain-containing protein n=1 Tax=Ridgeia piscesae TaxID=27915 RepID=A0AAD9NX34_RIDPI|nr:hypothetical protein NP493_283g02023 [Ridgeia piscesae]
MANDMVGWGILVLVLTAATSSTQAKRYDRYQVIKIGPVTDNSQLAAVRALQEECDDQEAIMMDADFVNAMRRPVLLAFGPKRVNSIKVDLRSRGIPVVVVTRDLQVELDHTKKENNAARRRAHPPLRRNDGSRLSNPWKCLLRLARGKSWRTWARHILSDPNWRRYICSGIPKTWHGVPLLPNYFFNAVEIVQWMVEVARASKIATVYSIGKTYEGRDTTAIKINEKRRKLPIVWVDAGMHAREWLSVSTALYLIHTILFSKDRDAVYLRNNFRWYIVPTSNPDGYAYSHTADHRMWRKNRKPTSNNCIGTDLNRNFDFHWGQFGSSKNACSPIYRGKYPFSEVETRNLRDSIWPIRRQVKLLLNLHTYDQAWVLPYLGLHKRPADYAALETLAKKAVASLKKVHGKIFRVGRLDDVYGYKVSGSLLDWAYDKAKIKYTYLPELRPAMRSQGGFTPPISFILPSGEELFAALVTCCRHIAKL